MTITSSAIPALDRSSIASILRHCDEPTRDRVVQASRFMRDATNEARRRDYLEIARRPGRWTQELLPSAIELQQRGCPKPRWECVAKTMQVDIHAENSGALARRYALASNFNNHGHRPGYTLPSGTYEFPEGRAVLGSQPWQNTEHYDVITDTEGRRYEGTFRCGLPDGQGLRTYPGGARYEGEFKAGKADGRGVYTGSDGSCYEGEFKAGMRHGQGTLILANKERYEGDFKAGQPDGWGQATLLSGDFYTGDFKAGRPDGQGICTRVDGRCYVGDFKDGMQDGVGVETLADGVSYKGSFKADQRQGRGTVTVPGVMRYESQFNIDRPVGHLRIILANGQSYEGCVEDLARRYPMPPGTSGSN